MASNLLVACPPTLQRFIYVSSVTVIGAVEGGTRLHSEYINLTETEEMKTLHVILWLIMEKVSY